MTLRAPIISVLGHVDAGKTSLMDMLRGGTKVQANEAGGITQSISCSMIPSATIKPHIDIIEGKFKTEMTIPGLLMIDTPGHKSFNIMRDRGSSLCDIAIVVIGLHEGIKPQTIESIEMLKNKKVPFIIAMTKLDMLDGYNKSQGINTHETSLQQALKKQSKTTINYMESHIEDLKYDLSKINITAEFYHKNKKPNTVYSIVPVSSKTREGLSDILSLIVYIAQTMMINKLTQSSTLDCTVMECIQHEQMWVLDTILKSGNITVGDMFAVAGEEGEKIITVRNMYLHTMDTLEPAHSCQASAGIRIICSNAEGTYTGVKLHGIMDGEDVALEKAHNEMKEYWSKYELNSNGIVIMAPTFGEIDAMYNVYTDNNINIKQMIVGAIKEKHLKRIIPTLSKLDDEEYRCIVYFGEITQQYYDELEAILIKDNIHLIYNPVVYGGMEMWLTFKEQCIARKKENMVKMIQKQFKQGKVVFPCNMSIFPEFVFMKGGNDDLLIGVKILNGTLYRGTPLTCNGLNIGRVLNIEKNKQAMDSAKQGDEVCIRIENKNKYVYGKPPRGNFDDSHCIISTLTRESIDILKQHYKEHMTNDDWSLVMALMKKLNIPSNKK